MVELPDKETQVAFYLGQIDELLKVNLQNEYTRLRHEARLAIAEEEGDEDMIDVVKAKLKENAKEFKTSELYIRVAREQIEELKK